MATEGHKPPGSVRRLRILCPVLAVLVLLSTHHLIGAVGMRARSMLA